MPSLGIIFPGQGSQAVGMGADVVEHCAAARECFTSASSVLGYDLLSLVISSTPDELKETRVSQPAIFTANVAIYRAVESLGYQPLVAAGHSFGEYCALTIADAIDFDEAVRIVSERGQAMGEAADLAAGTMAAIIGLPQAQVEDVCRAARAQSRGRVDIGNLNTPEQIVISGDVAAVDAACALAKDAGAKRVRVLNVSGAWHSELMQPAMPRFTRAVAAAALRLPQFTVISNVTAQPYTSVDEIRRCLSASLCQRVRWHDTAAALAAMQPDIIIECGASEVLAPMMRRLADVEGAKVVHVADSAGVAKLQALCEASAV